METAEREILSLLGSANSLLAFLTSIAIIGLGLALVRPLNKTAGIVYAVGGAARFVGVLLDLAVTAVRPEKPDLDTILLFSSISTLLWLVVSIVFYGSVIFGTIKLAETHAAQSSQPARGAW